ncbi:NHL repeat-containing protein [Neorhodopirellula lusitana]|uniref:hypothetical protein n=1 Tax=Neorhodopirellula lusitana TaxID=445327 RepID=UPI00384E0847
MRSNLLAFSIAFVCFSAGFAVAEDAGRVEIIAGNGRDSNDEQLYSAGEPQGSAKQFAFGNPFGVQPVGSDLFFTTISDHCVWRMDRKTGDVVRVAGCGLKGYSGDGGPATEARFNWPHEVRVDSAGNLFIADTRNHVIRKVDANTQVISTIAGCGVAGDEGDGGPATKAKLNQPHSVVLDGEGGILIADIANHRIRHVDLKSGLITTVAGTGERKLPKDGDVAAESPLFGPRSLAVDKQSIWLALREGNSIWRIDRASGKIRHVAGSGKKGYSIEGTPLLEATFNGPKGLALDQQGDVLVSDTENQAIRRVSIRTNQVTTLIGGRLSETTSSLRRPHGVAVDGQGNVLVGDSENHRVLMLKQ